MFFSCCLKAKNLSVIIVLEKKKKEDKIKTLEHSNTVRGRKKQDLVKVKPDRKNERHLTEDYSKKVVDLARFPRDFQPHTHYKCIYKPECIF